MTVADDWEGAMETLWASLDALAPDDFVHRVDDLAARLPPGDPIGLFERGCARDSTGHSDQAVPLYRAALASGLAGLRRRRATIQLASSLRKLGDAAGAARLLREELAGPVDTLTGAVQAFRRSRSQTSAASARRSPSASTPCRATCRATTARSRATRQR